MDKLKGSNTTLVLLFAVSVTCVVIGVVIGYFARGNSQGNAPCLGEGVPQKIIEEADSDIRQKIFDGIDADNIRNFVREYTGYTHVAGTSGDERLADTLYNIWKEQGLDHVTRSTYDVLLSYPDENDPSYIKVEDGTGNILVDSRISENTSFDEVKPYPAFHAYSKSGDFEGELVFINYGLKSEIDFVVNNASIDLTGKILLCKLGKVFWATLVQTAHEKGASGVLFYPEPKDFSSAHDSRVYPESWWMPPSARVSGSLFTECGDPLSPGYPSLDSAYRYKEEDLETLPKIPALPISYGDAQKLIRLMGGQPVPSDWIGGLNVTYRMGPGFQDNTESLKMHVAVTNKRVNSSNVFGYITGSVEPDRYVLMGNHRDSWSIGAVDPTGGTGIMMEMSRVMASLVKQGWRPRRTIVFCSWGAEEYGIIGSFEWVEEHTKTLIDRAVAYLNMDMVVQGNYSMRAGSGPMFPEALYSVAKTIESPNHRDISLYEEWFKSFPDEDKKLPSTWSLGIGSDFSPFVVLTGVSSIHVSYTADPKFSAWGFPLYHTQYDTFHVLDSFIDKGFKYSQTMGKYYAEMLRYMGDSLIVPLDVTGYNKILQKFVKNLNKGYGEIFKSHNITLDYLDMALQEFIVATTNFSKRKETINTKNPIEVRTYNDQIMMLGRAFLDPAGTPYNPQYKNLLFGVAGSSPKAGSTFPGLVTLVSKAENSDDSTEEWEEVKKHVSVIVFTFHSAADALSSSTSNSFEI